MDHLAIEIEIEKRTNGQTDEQADRWTGGWTCLVALFNCDEKDKKVLVNQMNILLYSCEERTDAKQSNISILGVEKKKDILSANFNL
jgi:hypothetical protein